MKLKVSLITPRVEASAFDSDLDSDVSKLEESMVSSRMPMVEASESDSDSEVDKVVEVLGSVALVVLVSSTLMEWKDGEGEGATTEPTRVVGLVAREALESLCWIEGSVGGVCLRALFESGDG